MLFIIHSVPFLAFTFCCFEGQLPAEVSFSQAKKLQHRNNIHPGRTAGLNLRNLLILLNWTSSEVAQAIARDKPRLFPGETFSFNCPSKCFFAYLPEPCAMNCLRAHGCAKSFCNSVSSRQADMEANRTSKPAHPLSIYYF